MIDTTTLYKGLCALARSARANAMAGHLGAAVIAGSFFLEQHPELDGSVHVAIAGELDRIIAGEESLWFDPTKSGITIPELFAPFPETVPQSDGVAVLAEALVANIDETRQSGHNVIFTALGIKALAEHPRADREVRWRDSGPRVLRRQDRLDHRRPGAAVGRRRSAAHHIGAKLGHDGDG